MNKIIGLALCLGLMLTLQSKKTSGKQRYTIKILSELSFDPNPTIRGLALAMMDVICKTCWVGDIGELEDYIGFNTLGDYIGLNSCEEQIDSLGEYLRTNEQYDEWCKAEKVREEEGKKREAYRKQQNLGTNPEASYDINNPWVSAEKYSKESYNAN